MRRRAHTSRSLVFLAVAWAVLGGCAHTSATRSPEAGTETAAVASSPAAVGSHSPAAARTDGVGTLPKPDTYVVQPGDTLALIARRPEIYGDSAMWLMLYRGNLSRMDNADWLCPGQVLSVPRQFSEADVKAVREEALRRAPWPPGAKATPTYLCHGQRGPSAVPAGTAKPDDSAAAKRASDGGAGAAAAKAASQPTAVGAPSADGTAGALAATPAQAPASETNTAAKTPPGKVSATPPVHTSAVTRPTGATGRGPAAGDAHSSGQTIGAPSPAPATPAPVSSVGLSRNAFLDAARRAYNVGDIQWATYYYRQYLRKSPRDAEALGELGNIYYRAGNRAAAANLYYEAARISLDRGDRARAAQLLQAVSEGNPALANDLYARLMAPVRP